jgi:hypothetical protein
MATIKSIEKSTTWDLNLKCPRHIGNNVVSVVVFDDGDEDVYCWCGVLLAFRRNGVLYTHPTTDPRKTVT